MLLLVSRFRFGRLLPLLLFLLLWPAVAVRASHIVGGELELQHVSGSTYTLTLNLYFDAINGRQSALANQVTAGIFEQSTNRTMTTVPLPLVSNTFVAYTNPSCTQPTLSTRKLVYRTTLTLSAATYTNATGYYAVVENCCRNAGVLNILDSSNAGQAFYLEFPAVVRNGQPFLDSTPSIFPPLSDYACLNELFYYDFAGRDPDGDSLAYDLVTPLNGHAGGGNNNQPQPAPYSLVNWQTGYSEQSQIPGSPALNIDARTGRLTVRPNRTGLFVFGIRCQEFRGGRKIGETRRDFQLYTLICPQNAAPSLRVLAAATGRPYRPGLDTLHLRPGSDHCLRVRYTDPDASSQLTVSVRPVNYSAPLPTFTTATSGVVRAAGAPDTLTAAFCLPECQDSQGRVLLLDVIVADNGCSLPRRDTVRVAFTIEARPNTAATLTSTLPPAPPSPEEPVLVQVPIGSTYTARLTGFDPDPDPLTLSATGQGFNLAAAGITFAGQNGTGAASGTLTWQPTCALAAAQTDYVVSFQLREETGCETRTVGRALLLRAVPVTDSVAFRPPNIITPNHDGKNDVFTLPTLPADLCDGRFAGICIYSRWGTEVFHSDSRSFRWDGAGTAGTYFYLITYTDGRRFKGWLEVVP